ncbi:nicotinate (nicotinamide) nucleotide adenylyltransferase [Macrococcoides canis]|uniref:nicotinate (nicotinamide) nucleotide adenylyltransferase n=1 Tax=Macrococcoides canis TaxID=1855823 RepID=UPI0013E93365|nr:nicotinate (nicotinamide) nucleotide adenylyltransferase [Macrococcus canis]MCO4095620.1 nicotinate (nicotinamide) nucleotide adenylyltransferase [Macrococcus canis]QIH76172.1 nicotinate (nicotinamide) nucleotide adenylyltransferase [Macrococcus canis]QTQ07285.1 nicotinate (nicotinamide) nucleotide adenylyltransferase [Macrococcus canis]QUR95399.1 nicotinate (nicotinamide) nucleotide adenylyltransferase [Macrococcus canis]UTH01540.1 nicotinate (nicotinamide) nucleotide adenylyltransferase [
MNIILYGGSFDPIHIGHAFVANEVYHHFQPDKFIFMPAGQSPHKQTGPNASDQDRAAMIQQSIDYLQFGEIDTFEMEQSGKSYTYHTVLYLKEKYEDCTLKILIGYDQYEAIDKWYNIEAIKSLATFIVVNRSRDELNLKAPFIPFTLPRMDVSSTDIRQRLAFNQSVKCLLLNDVEQYIREEHLYEEEKSN